MQKAQSKNAVIGIIVVLVCVGTVLGLRYAKQIGKGDLSANLTGAKIQGTEAAPVRIVSFSDFQCPACRNSAPIISRLMEKYPGKIQYVFKHFPLRMHVWSGISHQTAECAAAQGKFWEMYHKLYDNQQAWSILQDPLPAFIAYARDINLNIGEFSRCLADPKIAEHVANEKKEGEKLEVQSTPTYFINGKMFAGAIELQFGGENHIRQILGLEPLPAPALPQAPASAQLPPATEPPAQPEQTKAA